MSSIDDSKSRDGTSLPDINEPISTAKAMLIEIVAPRVFETKSTVSSRDEVVKPEENTISSDTAILTENEENSGSGVEWILDSLRGKKTVPNKGGRETTFEIAEEEESKYDEDLNKMTDGSSHSSESEVTVLEEEIAALTSGRNVDETHVDMETLLRITFDKLLEEWHLLNMPTFSLVSNRHIEKVREAKNLRDGTNDDIMANSWIRLSVMAVPSSLGIIIDRLERIGIGTVCGTLSIYKAELCRTASPYAYMAIHHEGSQGLKGDPIRQLFSGDVGDTEEKEEELSAEAEKMRAERSAQVAKLEWKNAASRLRLEQIREQIAEQASMSFDYIALLAVASILAGIGLITDNVVVVVASMLVSPLMGPVLGLTFSTRIYDWK